MTRTYDKTGAIFELNYRWQGPFFFFFFETKFFRYHGGADFGATQMIFSYLSVGTDVERVRLHRRYHRHQ